MSKVLVELKDGSRLDLIGHQYIMSGEPQVVELSNLVSYEIAKGNMKLIARLKDGASQEDLKKAKNVDEFLKKFDANKKEQVNPNPNGNQNPSNK